MFGVSQGKERLLLRNRRLLPMNQAAPQMEPLSRRDRFRGFFLIMKKMKRETNLFGITFNKVVYYPLN